MCRFIEEMFYLEDQLKDQRNKMRYSETIKKPIPNDRYEVVIKDPGAYTLILKKITELEIKLGKIYPLIYEMYG